MTNTDPIIVIVGPTAVGKTDLSLDVAQALDAEIINADSMQLYRGMDIGTAKIAVNERRNITHHMLDVLDVTETANVADYQKQAREIIQDIQSREHRVVVAGGSGLFVQALLEDMQFPGSDPDVRARLTEEANEQGIATLYERLTQIDPEAAANILPTNERRIIRALEVVELTGQVPTTTLNELPEVLSSIRIGLRRSRTSLDERVEQRVHQMWDSGFVEEVKTLASVGLRDGLTASKALGYAQILDFLAGQISETDARSQTIQATRRFVRRQESWFNRDSKIHWFEIDDASFGDLSPNVLAYIKSHANV